jgi:hypothetical protein
MILADVVEMLEPMIAFGAASAAGFGLAVWRKRRR